MIDNIKNLLINVRGYKTSKKVVVIESDDWGSVRMPSVKSFQNLLDAGVRVDKCGYNTYDNLESAEDLHALFDTFRSIKTLQGNHPVLTANTIVANPDYDRIKDNNFNTYEFETFDKSYLRYQGSTATLDIVKDGIKEKLYYPQLHGREHIFISNWMNALKAKDKETMIAFENNVYGLSTTIIKEKRKSFLTALDFTNEAEIVGHEQILTDAAAIFKKTFGFSSDSFIAPNYTWHPKHELLFKNVGIKYLQGGRAQKSPQGDNYETIRHYMGKRNINGLFYSIRNATFEPATKKNIDWKKNILQEAKAAFTLRAPLIISTHRVNFMGGLVENNRTENLKLFKSILLDIIKLYPDVEFISSAELGRRMSKNKL